MRSSSARSNAVMSTPAGSVLRVQRHVDERARGVFDGFEALVEPPRLLQAQDQLVGDRLARRVMQRVPLQDRGLERPVLEQLRRQFDEIAQHVRAGQALVRHLRQEPVQPVPELVEQRAQIVGRQERRRARRPLREIVVVDDDRQRLAVRARLPAIGVHPGAAALVRPREVVAQEDPDQAVVGAAHFEARGRRGDRPGCPAARRSERPNRRCAVSNAAASIRSSEK